MRFLAALTLGPLLAITASSPVFGQDAAQNKTPAAAPAQPQEPPKPHHLDIGTHVPLSLINSVSTRNSSPGDRVYLETVFPILADGRIVIPPGSYVMGTITE